MSQVAVESVAVALMTANTPELRREYFDAWTEGYTSREELERDMGQLVGVFVTIVDSLREQPVIAPGVDAWLQALARRGELGG